MSSLCHSQLTHWGRVMYICVSKLTISVSDNGLSPGRCQAFSWTNASILPIRPPGTWWYHHMETYSELPWNINRNWCIFIQVNVVWEMGAILFWLQCVKFDIMILTNQTLMKSNLPNFLDCFDSLWPGYSIIIYHWAAFWVMVCCLLFNAKPLPKPRLTYCQLDLWK